MKSKGRSVSTAIFTILVLVFSVVSVSWAISTTVTGVNPRRVKLTPGQKKVVTLKGKNLDRLTGAYVVAQTVWVGTPPGRPLPRPTRAARFPLFGGIKATLGRGARVILEASRSASHRHKYQLYLRARKQVIPVRPRLLTIEVVAPQFVALEQPDVVGIAAPALGMPMVSSYGPSERGFTSQEIKFFGRDYVQNSFAAKIGSVQLAVTYRSQNEIRAVLPSSRMTGPLVVGYGTPSSEYVVEQNYEVYGDAVVTGVTPSTFHRGDQVTITGTDLHGAFPGEFGQGDVSFKLVKLSHTSSSTTGSNFLRVYDWSTSVDGRTITFLVSEAYSRSASGLVWIDPQPTNLTGKLRMQKPGGTAFTVASPAAVSWHGLPPLSVTALDPPRWANQSVSFIIVNPDRLANHVGVTGQGLNGSTASIGGVELTESISWHGRDGWVRVPYEAYTNPITFTRAIDNASANSPTLTVVPWPQFTPEAHNTISVVFQIKLNTTYLLQGWFLKPSSVPGLTYEFILSGLPTVGSCAVQFNLVRHTPNVIEFRVNGPTPLPAICTSLTVYGGTPGGYTILQLKAKYGGGEKELFQVPYHLIP